MQQLPPNAYGNSDPIFGFALSFIVNPYASAFASTFYNFIPSTLICFSLYLFLKYNHQTFPFHSQILRGQSIDQSLYVVDSGLLQTARPLSCGGQLFGSKREVGYLLLNILCATFLVPI